MRGRGRFTRGCNVSFDSQNMKMQLPQPATEGRIGWILLWVLGVPLPILLILYLLRGCT